MINTVISLRALNSMSPNTIVRLLHFRRKSANRMLQRLPGSGSTQSVKVSVYLYYDDHKALDEKHCEMAAIDRVLELKNAGSQVDDALWQEYRSCVSGNPEPQG